MKAPEQIRSDIIAKASSDVEFRSRLISSPRQAVKEIADVDVPQSLELSVHEESATNFHIVIPPANKLSHSQLAAIGGASGGNYEALW